MLERYLNANALPPYETLRIVPNSSNAPLKNENFVQSSLFNAKIDVVDPQRRQVLVWTLYVEQQPPK